MLWAGGEELISFTDCKRWQDTMETSGNISQLVSESCLRDVIKNNWRKTLKKYRWEVQVYPNIQMYTLVAPKRGGVFSCVSPLLFSKSFDFQDNFAPKGQWLVYLWLGIRLVPDWHWQAGSLFYRRRQSWPASFHVRLPAHPSMLSS